jgi:hypothetical protein
MEKHCPEYDWHHRLQRNRLGRTQDPVIPYERRGGRVFYHRVALIDHLVTLQGVTAERLRWRDRLARHIGGLLQRKAAVAA